MKKEQELTLEDYTMEFFRKASVSKTISTISKILLLIALPCLIIGFKSMGDTLINVSIVLFIGLLLTWVFSTRSYNHLNMRIKLNLWLHDMANNPEEFQRHVQKMDTNEKSPN